MDQKIFEARPGLAILVLPDAPKFTVVAVSDDFVRISGIQRQDAIGRGHLDLFPPNPADTAFNGDQNVKASYDTVMRTREPHRMAVQRYDIPTQDGKYSERYWQVLNVPVLSETNEIQYLIHTADDITDQVLVRQKEESFVEIEKAYKKVEESEAKYRTLFDSMDQGFCILEVIFDKDKIPYDYRLLEINPAFEKQTGLKDASGKRIMELAPGLEERWPRIYGNIALHGEPIRFIDESKALNRWFDIYAFRLGGNDSRKVAAFFTDITERKLAEQDLKESNERFRTLADESPLFVFIIDPDPTANVNYWNKSWLQYTGQSMDEAIGRAWNGIIHPDDISVVMELYVPAFEKQLPYIIPAIRVKRYDGIYQWYSFKGNPRYLANGEFNGYVGVGFDIHEQKLAEEALKLSEIQLQQKVKERTLELENQKNLFDNILKNSSNGISVTEMIRDKTGRAIDARTIMANDAAVNYIGLPREIYLGKTAVELDPNILESEYGKTCLQTLETGIPAISQYYFDVNNRWQEVTISKMDDDHLIHIFTDITPIKEAQLQLERTVKDLKHSNTNLEEFAYAASHDLKEPIRKIHIFSDRLKISLQDKMGETDRNYFDRMDIAARRMDTLIDDLLQYSYVSKGATTQEKVDLNKVVKIVLEDLDMEIEMKQAMVKTDKLPVIYGNNRQLQQMFQNLIGNALKYNHPGMPPDVKISCRLINNNEPLFNELIGKGKYHLIELSDKGIGFDQSDATRVFNVFTRLQGSAESKGSGVGLSIVRKVVENHKGQIWAEAVKGEGAVFKILLPESNSNGDLLI